MLLGSLVTELFLFLYTTCPSYVGTFGQWLEGRIDIRSMHLNCLTKHTSPNSPNTPNMTKYAKYCIWHAYLGKPNIVKWGIPEKIVQNAAQKHWPYVNTTLQTKGMTKSNFGARSPLLQCKTWSCWPKVPTMSQSCWPKVPTMSQSKNQNSSETSEPK